MKYLMIIMLVLFGRMASAHEMVPTYPALTPSHLDGLVKTTMTMFNKRADVEYYEVGVFDKDWEPLPFVSSYKIFQLPYLSTVTFDVYIRNADRYNVTYICSISKIKKSDLSRTAVTSKICSKVKKLEMK